jgi:hypothetical protein
MGSFHAVATVSRKGNIFMNHFIKTILKNDDVGVLTAVSARSINV